MSKTKHLPKVDSLLRTALRAAALGAEVLTKYFGKPFPVREKKNAGLVTPADEASESAIIKALKRDFPSFEFVAEEQSYRHGSMDLPESEGRWYIDPLDGTTNFVHGFPMFCISIAAEWRGEIQVGVIHHPIFQEVYWAQRGKGAFLNKKRLSVSRTRDLQKSFLTTGFTYRKDRWLAKEMEAFESLSQISRAIRRPGSAALDLAYTARGVFDGFWERRLSPWDIAAGGLIVEEAGGKVTDFSNEPFSPWKTEILATNSILHRAILQHITPHLR